MMLTYVIHDVNLKKSFIKILFTFQPKITIIQIFYSNYGIMYHLEARESYAFSLA